MLDLDLCKCRKACTKDLLYPGTGIPSRVPLVLATRLQQATQKAVGLFVRLQMLRRFVNIAEVWFSKHQGAIFQSETKSQATVQCTIISK